MPFDVDWMDFVFPIPMQNRRQKREVPLHFYDMILSIGMSSVTSVPDSFHMFI